MREKEEGQGGHFGTKILRTGMQQSEARNEGQTDAVAEEGGPTTQPTSEQERMTL